MQQSHSQWLQSVFATYEAKLLRYAGDIVGASLASDVVQDTFLKLCRQPREQVESHLSAWLFTVCRNGAIEIRRKVRRLKSLDDEAHQDLVSAPAVGIEDTRMMTYVQSFIAQLPEQQRELIRLKYDGELSYKEIAEVTGLSVSNVGFILHTALANVRAQLAREEQRVNQAGGRR